MSYKYKTEYQSGSMICTPFPRPKDVKHRFRSEWLITNWSGTSLSLAVPANYAWDGCTVVKDWAWNKRGSLFHDALYQYAGQHGIPRHVCDYFFFKVCLEDSHEWWESVMAGIYYLGVRAFGGYFWRKRVNNGT